MTDEQRKCPHCGGVLPDEAPPGTAVVLGGRKAVAPIADGQIEQNLAVWKKVEHGAKIRQGINVLREARSELLFAYWKRQMHKPQARYDPKGRGAILLRAQVLASDDMNMLLYVPDGTLRDSHLMGQRGNSDRAYNGIETIYKDLSMIERLSELGGYRGEPHPIALEYPALCLPPEAAQGTFFARES